METVIHNDYRQRPITSDEECERSHQYLERLEEMIADQEDVTVRARAAGDEAQLAQARTSLWRLLTKRQGVVDALTRYEQDKSAFTGDKSKQNKSA